ncbi:MAG: hypothetical protein M1519_08185 [Actinobacteria bacterium]|nr:hypothetical protein [Actinomycetota bacterium]
MSTSMLAGADMLQIEWNAHHHSASIITQLFCHLVHHIKDSYVEETMNDAAPQG